MASVFVSGNETDEICYRGFEEDVKRTGTPRITSSGAAAVTRGHTAICENSLQKTDKHFNIGHVGFLETALKIVFKMSYHHEISR